MMKQEYVDEAWARYQMFTEAADHLDGAVTDDETEQGQIPYVQSLIRRNAAKWKKRAIQLQKNLERVSTDEFQLPTGD